MRVFITGASGLVGRDLVRALLTRGDTVLPLSRRAKPAVDFADRNTHLLEPIVGDPSLPGPWLQAIPTCDAVVHLAGEPIFARRWSDSVLERIRSSRVDSTELIAKTLATLPLDSRRPRTFVSGSAVGYYGADTGDRELRETDAPGQDVLSQICREWESAAAPALDAGLRVCHPRTGIVLDPRDGALPRMVRPFHWYVGGRIATGRQFISWIHRSDMTQLLLFALDNTRLHGAFNACAPNPVTNRIFSGTLARVLRKPNWLPAPRYALRLALGRVTEIVAGGQRAYPTVVESEGYKFQFPDLEPALRDLLTPQPIPDSYKTNQVIK